MAEKAKKKNSTIKSAKPAKPTGATDPNNLKKNIIRQGRYKYLPGHKFNKLTILKRITGQPQQVICVCECGKKPTVALKHLVSGATKSCGCLGPGRPTDYKPEYSEQVKELCLLGGTDQHLADFFSVTVRTIQNWKNEHPQFLHLVAKSKIEADSLIAMSLFKRAAGYERQEEKLIVVDNVLISRKFEKHYPPDTAAMMFWLSNRNPDVWKKTERLDVTVKKVEAVVTNEDQLIKLLNGVDDAIDENDEGVIDIEPKETKS